MASATSPTFNSAAPVSASNNPYTPAQVATINAARAANVNAGVNAYSGAGATTGSIANGNTAAGTGTPLYAAPTTINSSNTSPATSIQPPAPNPATNASSAAATSAQAQNSTYQAAAQAAAAAEDKATNSTQGTDSLASFNAMFNDIPPKGDVLSDPNVEAAHTALMQTQAQTNQDTGLLNTIQANASAAKLTLVGQGTGVPNAIIGGQQAEIDREAAIQSLPVAAKIAIDQGNQTLAQQNLTYMTSVVQEQVDNTYAYQTAQYDAISSFVSTAEANTLDALKTQTANAVADQKAAIAQADQWAQLAATNGQSTLASNLMKQEAAIGALNTASPTYTTDLQNINNTIATLSSGLVSLSAAAERASIAASYASTAHDNAETAALGSSAIPTPADILQYQADYPDAGIKYGDTTAVIQSKINPAPTFSTKLPDGSMAVFNTQAQLDAYNKANPSASGAPAAPATPAPVNPYSQISGYTPPPAPAAQPSILVVPPLTDAMRKKLFAASPGLTLTDGK